MSQQSVKMSLKGLYTTPSDLSGVPDGAMERADNIVIDSEDKAKPRRGVDDYGATFGASSTVRAKKIFFFGSTVFVHHGSTLSYSSGVGLAFTAYTGSFTEPASGQNITTAQINKNLYFATSTGVKKIDSLALQPKDVGVPKAIHCDASLNAGASGFLTIGYSVAYRVVWAYKDANNNLILGAPSQVIIVTSPPATATKKNVDFIIYIPTGITSSHFVQIYRSTQTSVATPSLELALVYEKVPTAAEITAKVMGTVTDIADDTIRGAFLYTSPSLGGSVVANDQPPLANVIGRFKSYLMYLNTISKYRIQISLLGTGATGATLKVDDYLIIGGITYTAKAAENVGARQFKVTATSGLPSEDIRLTCLSLCKVINQDTTATFYGFYLSDALTTPGLLLFEERLIGSTTGFGVYASVLGAFSPSNLNQGQAFTAQTGANTITPATSIPGDGDTVILITNTAGGLTLAIVYFVINPTGTTFQVSLTKAGSAVTISSNGAGTLIMPISAKNEVSLNRVYYSKTDQPEACPLLNYREVGAADKKVLIAMQLRESFIVLKEDGCFRISQDAPFQIDLIDSTQQLIGPDTAVVLNNSIYALTTQGIIVITEGGAQVIDLPIEADILALFGSAIAAIRAVAFAVAYETDRKYVLWLPSASTDTFCQSAIVYNTFTKAWTKWTLSKTCGIVNPTTDRMLLGSSTANGLNVERKNFDFTDYVDFGSNETISAQAGSVLTVSGSANIAIGDMIYQNATTYSFVTAISTITGFVTMLDPVVFSLAACKIYKSIQTAIKWTVQFADSPSRLKQFTEMVIYFKRFYPGIAYANFSSDMAPGIVTTTLTGDTQSAGWGLFAWGDGPWGGDNYRKPLRFFVPREQQRCSQLTVEITHAYAYGDWEILGMSLLYNPGSERV